MEVNTKKRLYGKFSEEKKLSNSYGSTNCIRFEGYNLSPSGHPFVFTATKVRENRK